MNMNDMPDSEILPKLNARMFQNAGEMSLSKEAVRRIGGERLITWCQSLDFHCLHNSMTNQLWEDADGNFRIVWTKRGN